MRYVVVLTADGIVERIWSFDSGRSAQAAADRIATRHDNPEHYDIVVWDLKNRTSIYNPYRAKGQ
jgi:hypothetical protein